MAIVSHSVLKCRWDLPAQYKETADQRPLLAEASKQLE
jgi:hypothetical protein